MSPSLDGSFTNVVGIRAAIQELADGMKQVTASQSRAGAMMNVFDVASSTARINGDTSVKRYESKGESRRLVSDKGSVAVDSSVQIVGRVVGLIRSRC